MRILAVILASCLPGCALHVDLPEQFLEVGDSSSSRFRATTADDALFFVERFDLPSEGERLAFWVDAVKNDLVGNRGYTLLEETAVVNAAKHEGSQMVFEATTQGRTYRYLVALFVEPGSMFSPTMCAVRFTAEKDVFARHEQAVRAAVQASSL